MFISIQPVTFFPAQFADSAIDRFGGSVTVVEFADVRRGGLNCEV